MIFYKTKYTANIIISLALLSILIISSCSITPDKISHKDKLEHANNALDKLYSYSDNKTNNKNNLEKDQSNISGAEDHDLAIDLRRAIKLAIDNNLEYKLEKLRVALAYKQYDLAKMDMYPQLNTTFSYEHRHRDYIKTLDATLVTGSSSQSLIPHTIKSGNITFSWNILDFGVSYMLAKQAGDRYRLAQEQRKIVTAKLMNEVIKNYLLAYYGQELSIKIAETENEVNQAIANIDQALDNRIGQRDKFIQTKKLLMQGYREIKNFVISFNQAKDNLLNLINYNSKEQLGASNINLLPPEKYLTELPVVSNDLINLDTIALYYRPELVQELYKLKELSKQKLLVALEKLPSFGFALGYNYDSDKFLKYQNWWRDNLTVAWNILNLATIPAARDTVQTQIEAEELTYLASSAVILSEIRAVLYNYKVLKYDYLLAEKESKYTNDNYQHSLNMVASDLLDEQSLLPNKLELLKIELAKIKTFIDARSLFEDLILSLGLYHSEGELIKDNYIDLTIFNKWLDKFNNEDFSKLINNEYAKLNNVNHKSSDYKSHS